MGYKLSITEMGNRKSRINNKYVKEDPIRKIDYIRCIWKRGMPVPAFHIYTAVGRIIQHH